jgi:hypothetical protein
LLAATAQPTAKATHRTGAAIFIDEVGQVAWRARVEKSPSGPPALGSPPSSAVGCDSCVL